MLDPAISAYFAKRKKAWLKKMLKSTMTNEQMRNVEAKCEEVFSLENWLPKAAKLAGQMSLSTHPCTFSHPSARKNKNGYVTSIVANSLMEPDGYLRTGNIEVEVDVLGNAAALYVHEFLTIRVQDGSSVLEHIQSDSVMSRDLLSIQSESYTKLKSGFIAMAESNAKPITSSKIKQVFFPIDSSSYHQLSILSNSGIIFEVRKRIDALRFSDKVKEGREARRNNHYFEGGYSEIYDITTIGYGGTKPQNISVLNNQNGGKAYLLLSVPPNLVQRKIIFPRKDFFTQNLRYSDYKDIFKRLDNLFKIERQGNVPLVKIRNGIDRCLGDVLDVIVQKMVALRSISSNQFWDESSDLPTWQKLWLIEKHREERQDQEEWLDTLTHQVTIWLNRAYKASVKDAILLGREELTHIEGYVSDNREIFR
jgi:CRISPR-associated protein Csy1